MAQNFEDPSRKKDGHLFNTIVCNRNKSACFYSVDRVFFDRLPDKEMKKLKKTPVCSSMFRSYSEVDIVELRAIQKILKNRGKLDKIDFQAMTCQFESHTIFSIFHDEERLHEKILLQIDEGDWPEEMQEDETEIQHNQLRRMYRVMILPVPDMKPTVKKVKTQKNEKPDHPIERQETKAANVKHNAIAVSENIVDGHHLNEKNQGIAQIENSDTQILVEKRNKEEEESNKKKGLYSVL